MVLVVPGVGKLSEIFGSSSVSVTRGTFLTAPLEGMVAARDGCSDNYAADCWSLRWALPQASGVTPAT
jgi:hypothetical protein